MKCKKCGFDGIIENGDWITCPNCGAKYFNTAISSEMSATKKIDEIENNLNADDSVNGNSKTAAANKKSKNSNSKNKLKETIDFLMPIIIAVVVALLLKTFVFANAVVPTGSMLNTIQEGDRLIASRIAYLNKSPERYDIILFDYPDDETQIFVKRVIGLPGETVTVKNGIAYVTDTSGNIIETDQSFITNGTPQGDYGPYYVPKAGDKISCDGVACYAENGMRVGSTQFIEKYCETDKDGNYVQDENGNYTVAENCYFCMGDNRNESLDSRFWDNTYVAENKILGEAKFKYYPEFKTLE